MSAHRPREGRRKPFSLRIDRPAAGVVRIAIAGELEMARSAIVLEALKSAIDDPEKPAVVLDLTELTFIDTWGVHTAFDAGRVLTKRDGLGLMVVGGGLQVKRVFSLIHVSRVVHMAESLEDAVLEAGRFGETRTGTSLPRH